MTIFNRKQKRKQSTTFIILELFNCIHFMRPMNWFYSWQYLMGFIVRVRKNFHFLQCLYLFLIQFGTGSLILHLIMGINLTKLTLAYRTNLSSIALQQGLSKYLLNLALFGTRPKKHSILSGSISLNQYQSTRLVF